MAIGSLPVSLCWHWVSCALSYYSLSWNRAFHLCNSGWFISCVCIMITYLLGSQDLGKSMPTFFQQVNGRVPESEPSLRALLLRASKNPNFWIAECTSPAGLVGPLYPIIIGNSWLYISEFKRVKNTRFGFIKVAALLSNTFPFDFHSRQFCVGMLERKPLTFRNAGCSSDGLIEISITGSKLKQWLYNTVSMLCTEQYRV